MSDGAGQQAWSFDALGRVVADRRTTNGVTLQFAYAYNLGGSLATLTYPSGNVVAYGYNAAGRALSAVDSANGINYATQAAYAPHGALCSLVNGGSITSTLTFNQRLQPNRIHVTTTGAPTTPCASPSQTANVLDFTYSFDLGTANNGNVQQIVNNRDSDRTQSFTYDELNRVAAAQSQATSGQHDWGLDYRYDIWGNLLEKQVTKGDDVPMLSVAVDANNRIVGYCYDAAGNLLHEGACPGSTYAYDAENRLVSTAGVNYEYDGDGHRVKKDNGKLYWYSGGQVLLETDLAGALLDEYVFFNGQRIARRTSTGAVYYFFSDHLGSARIVTDASGTIVEESDFYPFGGERIVVDALDNPYKFTGKERDTESGLDYFGARHYASNLGRFLQTDPSRISVDLVEPQSWNRYTYALNNPLGYVDRNGKWPTWIHNQIIDDVFGNLSESQRDILKAASKYVDRDQSRAGAFKHAMRAPWQSPEKAGLSSGSFIEDNLETAVEAQLTYEESGHSGFSPVALFYFGMALHTVTDSTSPLHRGYQEWHGFDFIVFPIGVFPGPASFRAAYHVTSEWARGIIGSEEAKQEARIAAERLWRRYLNMLREAKKKKEEERRKEKACRRGLCPDEIPPKGGT